MELHIRVKNVRGFEDVSPVSFALGKGFTAFVGPNNSGKSSLLKMFFELRGLWSQLYNLPDTTELFRGNPRGLSIQGVHDQREIFFDSNPREMELEFALLPESLGTAQMPLVNQIRLTVGRENMQYTAEFFCKPVFAHPKQNVSSFAQGILIDQTGQVKVDCRSIFECFRQLANGMYIGPFRNAISQGAAPYFDISIGSEFINTWNQWKTGPNKAQNSAIEQITEDIRKIFDFNKLEITASSSTNTLQVNVDGRPFKLGELGAGLS